MWFKSFYLVISNAHDDIELRGSVRVLLYLGYIKCPEIQVPDAPQKVSSLHLLVLCFANIFYCLLSDVCFGHI